MKAVLLTLLILVYSTQASAALTIQGKLWEVINCGLGVGNTDGCHFPTRLAFSDLISGPDTGLGDGNGSGVIVTVWGYDLGSPQGTSTIEFCDSAAQCRTPYVYYWKNADGILPSGPANLYESHGMQEIAFSIPDSALGLGEIKLTKGAAETTLPFTVRAGAIQHIMASGNDTTGDGSFGNPTRTLKQALEHSQVGTPAPAGATIYVHDSLSTGVAGSSNKTVYWNNSGATSGATNQFTVAAYPTSQPVVIGGRGFSNYLTEGMVVSKMTVEASNCVEVANGQPDCVGALDTVSYGIASTKNGRAIGNEITDFAGGCASALQGALYSSAQSADDVSNWVAYGNYVHDYGCAGSSKFHHTTYFQIRSGDSNRQIEPITVGWNYLKDNDPKNGIHFYDENSGVGTVCGEYTGNVKIHDNVIINQSGAGINIGANCDWSNDFEVYNNIAINVGLRHDNDGLGGPSNGPNHVAFSYLSNATATGDLYVHNNIFHTWNDEDEAGDRSGCLALRGTGTVVDIFWNDNICYTDKDYPFVDNDLDGTGKLAKLQGANNVWFYSGGTPTNAIVPTWDATPIITDPLLTITGSQISVGGGSPIIGRSNTTLPRGTYGVLREGLSNVGAVQ